MRAALDIGDDKIGYKIRRHTLMKTPYLIIVGRRESDAGTISLRSGTGEEWSADDLSARLREETPATLVLPAPTITRNQP